MQPDKIRESTKVLLAESLKELMVQGASFEKITIKNITDQAGLIRPTFYNHFQDKYELLEWIFFQDVIQPSFLLVDTHMFEEAVRLMLVKIEQGKNFYKKAIRVEGQNSFLHAMFKGFNRWLLEVIRVQGFHPSQEKFWMKPESIAAYFANSITFVVKAWIENDFPVNSREMADIYRYIVTHTIEEIIQGK